jgi:putative sigma-54 modulation protein
LTVEAFAASDFLREIKGEDMNIEIRGVHYDVTEEDRQLIEKKLARIGFVEENIVSIHFAILKEKAGYKFEATVHFRWGNQLFIHVNDFQIHEGIDKLFKKMSLNVSREKDRIKEHKPAEE